MAQGCANGGELRLDRSIPDPCPELSAQAKADSRPSHGQGTRDRIPGGSGRLEPEAIVDVRDGVSGRDSKPDILDG